MSRVLVIPAASPPHKPCIASPEQRIEMTRLAFERPPAGADIRIDLRELDRSRARPDVPSYSFDTLSELKREYPQLAFVVGADQLAKLHTWHRFPELLGLCHWVVLERKPGGHDLALQTLRQWMPGGLVRPVSEFTWETRGGTRLALVPTEAPALSSTEIRQAIGRTGEPPEDALSAPVLGHLKTHRIYGTRMQKSHD